MGNDAARPSRKSKGQESRTRRLAPNDNPIETDERTLSRPHLIVAEGDVLVQREIAGIWRSGPGLTTPITMTTPEYRVSVCGQPDQRERVFTVYESAVADADALAAALRVRLFYAERTVLTLLKDYRPASRA